MRKLFSLMAITCACLALATNGAQAAGLTDMLVSQAGVTPQQATGGAGSIFQYAKSQMTAASFAKVKSAVPDMGTYLAAAPKVSAATDAGKSALGMAGGTGSLGGLTGGATKMLGGDSALGGMAGKLQAAQALTPAFQQLGMDSGMVRKFLPVVVDYVKGTGGGGTASLLMGALGM